MNHANISTNSDNAEIGKVSHGDLSKFACFLVIGLLIIILNVTEIIIITRKKTKKNYEYMLLGLSTSDALLGFSFFIYRILHALTKVPIAPIFVVFFFSLTASIFNILALSLERMYAVLYPIQHRVLFTKSKLALCVAVIWISTFAITIAVSLTVDKTKCTLDGHVLNEVFYVAPMITTVDFLYVIIYLIILIKLCRTRHAPTLSANMIKRTERKSIVLCCMIALVFVLFTAPTAIGMSVFHKTPIWSRVPLLLNSISNSVVYFFLSKIDVKCCMKTQAKLQSIEVHV